MGAIQSTVLISTLSASSVRSVLSFAPILQVKILKISMIFSKPTQLKFWFSIQTQFCQTPKLASHIVFTLSLQSHVFIHKRNPSAYFPGLV